MPDLVQYVGRFFIIVGLIITGLGVLMLIFRSVGLPLPGRLPGDIVIHRKHFTLYFPVVTSIVVSALLSIILYLFFGRK